MIKEDYKNKDYYTEFDLELEDELKRLYKLMILKDEEVSPDEIFMLAKIKSIDRKVA
jgi:hypothetical protein